MSYKPNLKKWKKGDDERVADNIYNFAIRNNKSKVKISSTEAYKQTERILLILTFDPKDSDKCLVELGYRYPNKKLETEMYKRVIERVGKMFGDYNLKQLKHFEDMKLRGEGVEKPRFVKIYKQN